MKTIWKYELPIKDNFIIEIPVDAEILSIQTQENTPCLWALVESDNLRSIRKFKMYGTGHPISDTIKQKYIGTFQVKFRFVFHVFELLE